MTWRWNRGARGAGKLLPASVAGRKSRGLAWIARSRESAGAAWHRPHRRLQRGYGVGGCGASGLRVSVGVGIKLLAFFVSKPADQAPILDDRANYLSAIGKVG